MKRILLYTNVILCISFLTACNEDKDINNGMIEEESDSIAPTPCFTLSIEVRTERCTDYLLVLDASCTTDNLDSIDDIEVRWDLNNDGEFTNYDAAKTRFYGPSYLDLPNPSVTMEARDKNLNSSTITIELDLSELPPGPDLIAGELTVGTNGEFDINLDTVRVGEFFEPYINELAIGNFLDPSYTTHIYLNEELIQEHLGGSFGGYSGCSWSARSYSIDSAGTYQLYFLLDALNEYEEANEMNNKSAIKTLVVVE